MNDKTESNCTNEKWKELVEKAKPIIDMVITDYPHLDKFINKKDKFILDKDKNVIPATLFEWGSYLENTREERIVNKTQIDDKKVSTVFIGLDHNFCPFHNENYKPHIFETMIFQNDKDIYCERYSTWKEAEEGHERAVQWVKDGCKQEDEQE